MSTPPPPSLLYGSPPRGNRMNATDINDLDYEEVSNITRSVNHYQLLSYDYLYLLYDWEIASAIKN